MRAVETGATAEHLHTVRSGDSAAAWGNDVPVLATPVLLWLGEITAMKVIEDALEEWEMTVGYAHTDVRHLAATPVGWTVHVRATLTGTDGRMLTFAVEALDAHEVVFRGTHVRAVVDRNRFMAGVDRKTRAGEAGTVRS